MDAILERLNSAGAGFVRFAVPMLVQSSVLILILLLVDLALRKKVRAVFRYWIWLLVLAKLVLPSSLSSPLSLGYFLGDRLADIKISEAGIQEEPFDWEMIRPAPPLKVPEGYDFSAGKYEGSERPASPVKSGVEEEFPKVITAPAARVSVTWEGAVFLVWLMVVAAMGLLLLQRAMFVRGLVAQATDANGLMKETLESCRERIGVKRKVRLKVSANAASPAVCGLFRPVILLPVNLGRKLGSRDLRAVLMHELAHIKRGDLWVNLAQTLLQIVYFYNPLLWLANAMIRRVREQAVDEMVLVAMGQNAKSYPETLVNVAKLAFKQPALSLRLIGVVESKNALAGRIKRILTRPLPKSAKLSVLGAIVVLAIGCGLLPMGKAQKTAVEIEILPSKKKVAWGKPVDGVQVRLRCDRRRWNVNETITWKIDVHNTGHRHLRLTDAPETMKIDVDGRIFNLPALLYWVRSYDLKPGQEHRNISFVVGRHWPLDEHPFDLRPGKHTVKFMFAVGPLKGESGDSFRLTSNPVEIEIVPLKKKVAWGKVVNDLQLGLAFDEEQLTYAPGEELTLQIYVRNTGDSEVPLSWADLALNHPSVVPSEGRVVTYDVIDGSAAPGGGLHLIPNNTVLLHPGDTRMLAKTKYRDMLDPGKYRISQSCELSISENPRADYPPYWSDLLTTGELEFVVAAGPDVPWGEAKVSKLLAVLQSEKYVNVREPVIRMVEEIGGKEPNAFLIEQLESDNRRRRCNAALALEILGDRRGFPAIVGELNDTSYRPTTMIKSDGSENQEGQIRQDHYYAALLLGILGDGRAVPALIEATQDETINYQAAMSLGQIGDKSAIPALQAMLKKYRKQPFDHTRRQFRRLFAGYGLAMLGDKEGMEVVLETLNERQQNWTIRRHAIEALGTLGDSQAVPYLISALKDEHPNIRVSAARALGDIGDISALPALEEALKDHSQTKVNAPTTVSKAAAKAIAQIKAGDT